MTIISGAAALVHHNIELDRLLRLELVIVGDRDDRFR
jgi:hypothetical protein